MNERQDSGGAPRPAYRISASLRRGACAGGVGEVISDPLVQFVLIGWVVGFAALALCCLVLREVW